MFHIAFGFHYFRKRNEKTRKGGCEFCGQEATLRTYEASKWFTLYHIIPIVPLGRKQIVHSCSRCSKHREAPIRSWKRSIQASFDEMERRYLADPGDLSTAMEMLHLIDLRFPEEQTIAFAQKIEQDIPGMETIGALAEWYEYLMRYKDAIRFYELLAQTEDSDALKRKRAELNFAVGEYTRAYTLLSSVTTADFKLDFQALFETAKALRRNGNAREGLLVMKHILATFGEQTKKESLFLDELESFETELHVAPIIPRRSLFRMEIVGPIVSGIVVIIGFIIANIVLAQMQTLYVVNGLSTSAGISVSGRMPFAVLHNEIVKVPIEEGDHTVSVTVPWTNYRIRLSINNSIIERFLMKHVFVVNVCGSGALIREKIVYAGSLASKEEPTTDLLVGKYFSALQGIDYPFTTPPEKITLDSSFK